MQTPRPQDVAGFKRLELDQPYEINRGDRVAVQEGSEIHVFMVLMPSNGDTIVMARVDAGKPVDKNKPYIKVRMPARINPSEGKFAVYVPEDATPVAAQPVEDKPKRGRKPADGGETKIARCKALYQVHHALPKEDVVKMFVEQVGCTPAGANTYYLTCRKDFR